MVGHQGYLCNGDKSITREFKYKLGILGGIFRGHISRDYKNSQLTYVGQ